MIAARERAFVAASAFVFLASAAATAAWAAAMAAGMPMPGGCTMSMAWMRMPGQSWPEAAATFVAMWLLMMIAMMLPSLVPMLLGYRRALRTQDAARTGRLTVVAAAAYFAVWTALGAAAYPVGVALAAAPSRWPALAGAMPVAAAASVVLAGVLQLTRWKADQLARCRQAPACCLRGPADVRAAWGQGLRHGVCCVRCCAPFTLGLLATDVMDLGAMSVVAVAITAERWAPRPLLTARLSGAVVVAIGFGMLARALTAA